MLVTRLLMVFTMGLSHLTCLPQLHLTEAEITQCPTYIKYIVTIKVLDDDLHGGAAPSTEVLEADCVVEIQKAKRYLALEVHRTPNPDLKVKGVEKYDAFYYPSLEIPIAANVTINTTFKWIPEDR